MSNKQYTSGLHYLHPHMETSVVDNSAYIEAAVQSNGTKLFMPFFASKGQDNKVLTFTTAAQLLAEHGIPNFKEHGQAIYNALNFLNNGGVVYGMRLLPTTASHANQCLVANFGAGVEGDDAIVEQDPLTKQYVVYATDDEEQEALAPQAEGEEGTETVDPQPEEVVDPSLKQAIYQSLTDPKDIPTCVADAKEFPIISIYAKGRGSYGNSLAFSIAVETTLADSFDFTVYALRVFEVVDGANILVEGPYQVALFPEAVNAAGTSLYIKNVIDRYSSLISVEVNEANLDSVFERIEELDGENAEVLPFNQDILKLGEKGVLYTQLKGGKDGGSAKNGKLSNVEKTALLVKAYSGQAPFDTSIANKREFPFDVLLDANFEPEVKKDMAALAAKRGDCMAFLDCGLNPSSAEEAIALRPIADNCYTAIYGQSCTVQDSFTNANIPVTMTYFLAGKIPANDAVYGIQYPLAGPARGVISGFQGLSFNPYSDDKEALYKARINYLEQDYRQAKFMSQSTSQYKSSALSNINNVRVLMRMVRSVEEIADGYFFEFATDTILGNLQSVINNNLSAWVSNGTCKVAEATVYQNDYDAVQKIVRVRVEVVFVNVIERIVIEFNVGN